MTELDRWFPLARSEELVPRHVLQAQLLGQEIALWRDDEGAVNAWENRCPHRGVRLSIGFNTGTELRCQYHAWRFASGSGQCTFIPSHPQQKPAVTIRAKVYRAAELLGFVWVSLGAPSGIPALPRVGTVSAVSAVSGRPGTTLRSVFVAAPAAVIAAALQKMLRAAPHDAFALTVEPSGSDADALTLLLQPMNAAQTLMHGVLHAVPTTAQRLLMLRQQHERLTALRDSIEAAQQRGQAAAAAP